RRKARQRRGDLALAAPLFLWELFTGPSSSGRVVPVTAVAAGTQHVPGLRASGSPDDEEQQMRLKVAFAVLALAGLARPAAALHCGARSYPVGACSPDQCAVPCVRYKVCYQTVVENKTDVCYRPVYRTVMKELRWTDCKPVYEQHLRDQAYTTCRPVYEERDVVRRYVVNKPVYETHVRQNVVTNYRPVWTTYQVPQHSCTYHKVYQQHVRQECYTVKRP